MNPDRSIDPTRDQVIRLRDEGPEGPIVMVNLLKFRKNAIYPVGTDETALSGRDAYARYEHAFTVTVQSVSGAEVVFRGSVDLLFIGQAGEQAGDWDDVLIVRYPSRHHFLAMLKDPIYQEALQHRYAGLERTILLQCSSDQR